MSRRGGGTLAIFIIGALAIVVFSALLLFVDDESVARKRQEERLAKSGAAKRGLEPLPDPLEAKSGVEVMDDPGDEDTPPMPTGFSVEGRAEIEGGFGLHGVSFLDMERYEDGDYGAWLEEGPNDDVETGEDGRVTLRWSRGVAPVIVMALREKMEFVRVENATLIRSDDDGVVFSVERGETAPFKVIYRDPTGMRNLRLKDAKTGRVLRFDDDLHWIWRGTVSFPGGQGGGARDQIISAEKHVSSGPGGWIKLWPFRGVEESVELRAPGYLAKKIMATDIGARTEVLLEPAEGRVTGVLHVLRRESGGSPTPPIRLFSRLRPLAAGGADAGSAHGIPQKDGHFSIWEVPAGLWALDVAVRVNGQRRYASITFEYDGSTLDLGTINVDDWCGLRLRILDADGDPAAGLSVTASPLMPELNLHAVAEQWTIERNAIVSGVTDDDGRLSLSDLKPGTEYRISADVSAALDLRLEIPEKSGTWLERELRWEGRMVQCTFRFTIKGKTPTRWGAPLSGPWPKDTSWQKDNSPLEVSLAPGAHSFTLMAAMDEVRTFRIYKVMVEVPNQREYEADLDMK